MLSRTVSKFLFLRWNKIHIYSGYRPPSEGLIAEGDESNHYCQSQSAQIDWASKVMVAMLESTTHKSTGRLIYRVHTVQCPVSHLSVSLHFLSLLCLHPNLCRPLHHIAKTHINHWSMHLIFPPTCLKRSGERHRLHPGSVYLCYYRRINCRALSPFFSPFTEISMLSGKRLRMGCLSVCLGEKRKLLKKNPHSPFNILFEALEIDERYVIDFASWGLLFCLHWQLWASKPVEAAVSLAFIRLVMIRLHSTLCAQTFAIRHNDAHCHSSDVFSTSPLISLENSCA